MILDSFKLHSAVIQASHEGAFRIWDRAGELAIELGKIWPSLSAREATPNQQTLMGPGYQISPNFNQLTITLRGAQSLAGSRIEQIHNSFKLLDRVLEIKKITRISARLTYTKQFSSQGEANGWVLATGLVNIPSGKVFDQPLDSARTVLRPLYVSKMTTHLPSSELEQKRCVSIWRLILHFLKSRYTKR